MFVSVEWNTVTSWSKKQGRREEKEIRKERIRKGGRKRGRKAGKMRHMKKKEEEVQNEFCSAGD